MRSIPLSALILALGLGLTACGDKDDSSDPEGDTDTDSDTDSDSDSDGDIDLCGPWTGVQGTGATWSYNFVDANLSGTVDNEVTDYNAGTGLVSAESYSVLVSADYTITSTTTTDYRCDDDGYWILGQYTEYSMDYSDTVYDGWSDSVYEPPALLLPLDIAIGDTWTTRYVGTTQTHVSDPSPFESTVQQEVIEEAEVTVPAGTYDTLYVEFSGDGEGFSNIARGVGQVKSNVTELTSYEP